MVGIPAEAIADGTVVKVEVTYDKRRAVEKIEVIEGEDVVNPRPWFGRKAKPEPLDPIDAPVADAPDVGIPAAVDAPAASDPPDDLPATMSRAANDESAAAATAPASRGPPSFVTRGERLSLAWRTRHRSVFGDLAAQACSWNRFAWLGSACGLRLLQGLRKDRWTSQRWHRNAKYARAGFQLLANRNQSSRASLAAGAMLNWKLGSRSTPSRQRGGSLAVSESSARRYQLQDPDVRLMLEVRGDNAAAFDELMLRYQNRLVTVLEHLVGRRDRAEDLAQEVFLRVYRAAQALRGGAKFSTWLYTIANHVAANTPTGRCRGGRKSI